MNRQRRRPAADRVEIALERGQVTTVLIGSVVALGLVFLLGVVFGSKMVAASERPTDSEIVAEGGATSSSDAPLLTFHDALTSMAEQGAAGSEPTSSSSSSDGLRESGRKEGEEQPSTSAPATSESDTKQEKSKPAAAPSPEPKTEPPREKPKAQASSKDEPTFTVQVSSSRDKDDTERLADRLKDAGWDARVVAADIEGRGRWYRVRVGRYATRDEAMRRQAAIQSDFNLSGLVVAEQ